MDYRRVFLEYFFFDVNVSRQTTLNKFFQDSSTHELARLARRAACCPIWAHPGFRHRRAGRSTAAATDGCDRSGLPSARTAAQTFKGGVDASTALKGL